MREKLSARQQKAEESAKKQGQREAGQSVGARWAEQRMQYAENLKLRWGKAPRPELACNPWFQCLTEKEKNALPLCQMALPSSMFRDTSQSIGRINASMGSADAGAHVAPTILPKQCLWIELGENSRPMLGREALTMQGFPALPFLKVVEKSQHALLRLAAWAPSESLMQDLAGNAMSLPVVLAMLQCGFVAATWSSCRAPKAAGETPLSKDEARF